MKPRLKFNIWNKYWNINYLDHSTDTVIEQLPTWSWCYVGLFQQPFSQGFHCVQSVSRILVQLSLGLRDAGSIQRAFVIISHTLQCQEQEIKPAGVYVEKDIHVILISFLLANSLHIVRTYTYIQIDLPIWINKGPACVLEIIKIG